MDALWGAECKGWLGVFTVGVKKVSCTRYRMTRCKHLKIQGLQAFGSAAFLVVQILPL